MKNYLYSSVLKDEILRFLKVRATQGFGGKNVYIIQSLDQYLSDHNIREKELSPMVVDGWLSESSVSICDGTLEHYVSCAIGFGKFLNSLGYSAFIPEYQSYTESYIPYIFSSDEIAAIFDAADNMEFGSERSRFQFPMFLRLLYGCGLRHSEALYLRLGDVDLENGIIMLLNAKGNRDRLVPMDAGLTIIMREYCRGLYAKQENGPLVFEGEKGKIHDQCWARALFRKLLATLNMERTNLPKYARGICLHCFRHTFAVSSLRKQELAGIDSYDVSPLLSIYLGHAKLMETQRYLHMTAENSIDILTATSEYTEGMFPEVPL
jgi:integrase